MSNIEHRRAVIPFVSADASENVTLALEGFAGAHGIPMQEAYLKCEVNEEGGPTADAFLDSGVASVFKDISVIHSGTNVLLQRLDSYNVFAAAINKLRGPSWHESVGKILYGLEGAARIIMSDSPFTDMGANLHRPLSVATAPYRKELVKKARGYKYMVNASDFLQYDKPFPLNGLSDLRFDVTLEREAIAQAGAAFSYRFRKNPEWIYPDIKEKVNLSNYELRGLSYTHHEKTIGATDEVANYQLNNGTLASMQGIVAVVRLVDTINGATANSLTDFAGSIMKTIQYRVNGQLVPQLPTDVGTGLLTTNDEVEVYANKMHLAKLISRGSKWEIPAGDIGISELGIIGGETAAPENDTARDESLFFYQPFSNPMADWGSGTPLSHPNVEVIMECAQPGGSGARVDFFVLYDTLTTWEGGRPVVSSQKSMRTV